VSAASPHGHGYDTLRERYGASGDLEDGLAAAAAGGDDRSSAASGRIPQQETFTHGTSEQRSSWFRTGFETGDPDACDTFAAP
jgi:uncharacterized protein